ncbi:MAG: hypothetical protein K2L53_04525 [Clostridia bacterium]|nr:hypothetical protein [Clostridia bacterium]
MTALMNNALLAIEISQTSLIVLMAVLIVLIILLAVLATIFILGVKRRGEVITQPDIATVVAVVDNAAGKIVLKDENDMEKSLFKLGETVKVVVNANDGYILSNISVEVNENVVARFKSESGEKIIFDGVYEFIVAANTVVKAQFQAQIEPMPEPEVFTFDERFDGVGGKVVLTNAAGEEKNQFVAGETVRISTFADEGYYLARFAIDDEERELVEGVYEFIVTAAVKIDVEFLPIPAVEEVTAEPEIAATNAVDEDEDEEEVMFDGHNVIRFNKSFTAKLIQIDDVSNAWYTELKNELLSYKKVKDRMSWKRESYRFGKVCVARFVIRGKTLCIQLPLDPTQFEETKYKVEDISHIISSADTPCLYRIKNERRLNYAKDLIAQVMENMGTTRIEREWVDYYQPYDTTLNLIERQLVKKTVKFNGKTGFGGIVEKLTEDPTKAQNNSDDK